MLAASCSRCGPWANLFALAHWRIASKLLRFSLFFLHDCGSQSHPSGYSSRGFPDVFHQDAGSFQGASHTARNGVPQNTLVACQLHSTCGQGRCGWRGWVWISLKCFTDSCNWGNWEDLLYGFVTLLMRDVFRTFQAWWDYFGASRTDDANCSNVAIYVLNRAKNCLRPAYMRKVYSIQHICGTTIVLKSLRGMLFESCFPHMQPKQIEDSGRLTPQQVKITKV